MYPYPPHELPIKPSKVDKKITPLMYDPGKEMLNKKLHRDGEGSD